MRHRVYFSLTIRIYLFSLSLLSVNKRLYCIYCEALDSSVTRNTTTASEPSCRFLTLLSLVSFTIWMCRLFRRTSSNGAIYIERELFRFDLSRVWIKAFIFLSFRHLHIEFSPRAGMKIRSLDKITEFFSATRLVQDLIYFSNSIGYLLF